MKNVNQIARALAVGSILMISGYAFAFGAPQIYNNHITTMGEGSGYPVASERAIVQSKSNAKLAASGFCSEKDQKLGGHDVVFSHFNGNEISATVQADIYFNCK